MIKLISITPEAEKIIAYCCRVSSSENQQNKNITKLLSYCIKNKHWSIFEQAYMSLEIQCPVFVATQILRHRSFTFQQFSQRYSEVIEYIEIPELRRQDKKNRQNSIDDIPVEVQETFKMRINMLFELTKILYKDMLNCGIAKECARTILPQNTTTKLYMTGTIRSWIHYIELRTGNGTQKEHMKIALMCKKIFKKELPIISSALGF